MENHMKYSYFGDGHMSPWGEQIYFFPACLHSPPTSRQCRLVGPISVNKD